MKSWQVIVLGLAFGMALQGQMVSIEFSGYKQTQSKKLAAQSTRITALESQVKSLAATVAEREAKLVPRWQEWGKIETGWMEKKGSGR